MSDYKPIYASHGDGKFEPQDISKFGENVIFEDGVRLWHPENVEIGTNVYIGHNAMIKGYHNNKIIIGDEVFISPNCFIHGSGGVTIANKVGIGPGVMIFGSSHDLTKDDLGPANHLPLIHKPIVIETGCDIGMGAIIMGGVTLAEGTQVGAGAVVTKSTEPYSIVAGVPAQKIRMREKADNE